MKYKYSVMNCLTQNLKIPKYNKKPGVYKFEKYKIQILQECQGKDHYDVHNIYKGKRIFNNRYKHWNSDKHEFSKDYISKTKFIQNDFKPEKLNKVCKINKISPVKQNKKVKNNKKIQFRGKIMIR